MKTIYKYPLILKERQQIELPTSAKFLSLQVQDGTPTIWCMVDTSMQSTYMASVYIFGTGHEVTCSEDCTFLGTVQQGSYVWHVFTPHHIN